MEHPPIHQPTRKRAFLERLAEGLSHEAAVRVVAVNGDSAEGRLFAREVLGVAYYPSVIAFPAASRTFYKYKGRSRDAEALLRFLNMTCCAREDAMWALRPAGQRGVEAAGGGQWFNQRLPLGITPGAAAAVVAGGALVLAAAAAAVSYATSRRPGLQPEVVAELDVSLGRMGTLMLRALKARAGLTLGVGVGQAQAESPAAAAAAEATEGMGAGAKAHELEPGPLLSADEAAAVVGASAATAEAAPSPGPVPAEAASTPHSTHVPSQAAAPSAQPQLPPLGGNGNGNGVAGPSTSGEDHAAAAAAAAVASATTVATRELTAEERHRLTRLTDDELIALVNSDPNLDVVLAKLLGDKK
ncbi:hypothetical protein TSOC_005545 [Tetrabaena socialis]|uniref:Uncharacterized protein n=1 Tax=Tetrabaena socialis TaxID=47790 RepID=A0A2J8A627_9CHLO|nr:hypothetical protein TSOC_005545 [Tetrabaena socialis]|eukprot:PNH07955.1 hypothetical protein TSOC_005545 [Tetrabaena socialis]